MTAALLRLAAAVAAIALLAIVARAARAYLRFRGRRIVTCPETGLPAAVDMDARRAAASAALRRDPALRLRDCSRWPARRSCPQGCVAQVRAAPEACRPRALVARWCAGKRCALCGRPFGEAGRRAREPALLARGGGEAIERRDVPVELLPAALETHLPICRSCRVAETFRRRFPHLVLDDPRPAAGREDAP